MKNKKTNNISYFPNRNLREHQKNLNKFCDEQKNELALLKASQELKKHRKASAPGKLKNFLRPPTGADTILLILSLLKQFIGVTGSDKTSANTNLITISCPDNAHMDELPPALLTNTAYKLLTAREQPGITEFEQTFAPNGYEIVPPSATEITYFKKLYQRNLSEVAETTLFELLQEAGITSLCLTEDNSDKERITKECSALLTKAVSKNNPALLKALLAHGADPNSADEQGVIVLHTACLKNQVESVNALIKAGADVNKVNKYGYSAIHYATSIGCLPLVKKLVANGAHLDGGYLLDIIEENAFNSDDIVNLIQHNKSPFEIAVLFNNTDIINYLLDQEVDPRKIIRANRLYNLTYSQEISLLFFNRRKLPKYFYFDEQFIKKYAVTDPAQFNSFLADIKNYYGKESDDYTYFYSLIKSIQQSDIPTGNEYLWKIVHAYTDGQYLPLDINKYVYWLNELTQRGDIPAIYTMAKVSLQGFLKNRNTTILQTDQQTLFNSIVENLETTASYYYRTALISLSQFYLEELGIKDPETTKSLLVKIKSYLSIALNQDPTDPEVFTLLAEFYRATKNPVLAKHCENVISRLKGKAIIEIEEKNEPTSFFSAYQVILQGIAAAGMRAAAQIGYDIRTQKQKAIQANNERKLQTMCESLNSVSKTFTKEIWHYQDGKFHLRLLFTAPNTLEILDPPLAQTNNELWQKLKSVTISTQDFIEAFVVLLPGAEIDKTCSDYSIIKLSSSEPLLAGEKFSEKIRGALKDAVLQKAPEYHLYKIYQEIYTKLIGIQQSIGKTLEALLTAEENKIDFGKTMLNIKAHMAVLSEKYNNLEKKGKKSYDDTKKFTDEYLNTNNELIEKITSISCYKSLSKYKEEIIEFYDYIRLLIKDLENIHIENITVNGQSKISLLTAELKKINASTSDSLTRQVLYEKQINQTKENFASLSRGAKEKLEYIEKFTEHEIQRCNKNLQAELQAINKDYLILYQRLEKTRQQIAAQSKNLSSTQSNLKSLFTNPVSSPSPKKLVSFSKSKFIYTKPAEAKPSELSELTNALDLIQNQLAIIPINSHITNHHLLICLLINFFEMATYWGRDKNIPRQIKNILSHRWPDLDMSIILNLATALSNPGSSSIILNINHAVKAMLIAPGDDNKDRLQDALDSLQHNEFYRSYATYQRLYNFGEILANSKATLTCIKELAACTLSDSNEHLLMLINASCILLGEELQNFSKIKRELTNKIALIGKESLSEDEKLQLKFINRLKYNSELYHFFKFCQDIRRELSHSENTAIWKKEQLERCLAYSKPMHSAASIVEKLAENILQVGDSNINNQTTMRTRRTP